MRDEKCKLGDGTCWEKRDGRWGVRGGRGGIGGLCVAINVGNFSASPDTKPFKKNSQHRFKHQFLPLHFWSDDA